MGCIIEFTHSQFEFCCQGNKQQILVDVLLKYSGMTLKDIATALDVSVEQLQDICDGENFFSGEQSDSLAQLFLIFFSRMFFRKCSLIRSY